MPGLEAPIGSGGDIGLRINQQVNPRADAKRAHGFSQANHLLIAIGHARLDHHHYVDMALRGSQGMLSYAAASAGLSQTVCAASRTVV